MMKKTFFSIFALLAVFALITMGCPTDDDGNDDTPPSGPPIEIDFVSLTKTPTSSTTTTTSLTLTFSAAIKNLSEADITLSGVTPVPKKGTLVAGDTAGTYTLPITVYAAGNLTVAVAKKDYVIEPPSQTIDITISDVDAAFYAAEAYKDIIHTNDSGLFEFDEANGIISRSAPDGYGDYFGIKIPEAIRPIIASDTITITYLIVGSAELTGKVDNTDNSNDYIPADFGTWSGTTKVIPATRFGAKIPTEYLYFQGRPMDAPWKLKIISVTKETGDPILVSTPVSGLKPVANATPVTAVDTAQYAGTVSWSPTVSGTFTLGTAYTATIALTAKAGYTFAGVAANGLSVAGAATVTHAAGTTTTLSITATFDAAKVFAPPLNVTFDAATSGGNNAEVSLLGTTGLKAETSEGYGSAYVYFKVTFATGFKLSDYSKIDFTVKYSHGEGFTSGDTGGYKAGYMMAYKPVPLEADEVLGAGKAGLPANGDIRNETANLVFTETVSWGASGAGNLDADNSHTVSVRVPTGTDENEVWIVYTLAAPENTVWELKDIKFYNPE